MITHEELAKRCALRIGLMFDNAWLDPAERKKLVADFILSSMKACAATELTKAGHYYMKLGDSTWSAHDVWGELRSRADKFYPG